MPNNDSEWTFETLHAHLSALRDADNKLISARFDSLNKLTDAALSSAQTAVLKAESAAEKRFESINEFRATLSDQQRTLMPRSEAEITLNTLREEVKLLKESQIANMGKGQGLNLAWLILIGFLSLISIVLGIVAFFKP
jgi:chemotaxis protein CheY-P-specific phosphatase CheC